MLAKYIRASCYDAKAEARRGPRHDDDLDDTYKTGRLLLGNDVIKMMMLMHIIRNFLVSTQMLMCQ